MKKIFDLDYKDYKNTSLFLENYYSLNIMDNIEKQFLLSQSLKTGNLFIFNIIENIENKNIYFETLYNSLKELQKNLYLKIKITCNNDKKILEKYNFFTKKFENIENNNWNNLEKYFYTLMYYNELIENLQTLETITI